MTWNYRVIKRGYNVIGEEEEGFGVHEVYYDDEGFIKSWSVDSQDPYGETLEELQEVIQRFMDATKKPILLETVVGNKECLVELA